MSSSSRTLFTDSTLLVSSNPHLPLSPNPFKWFPLFCIWLYNFWAISVQLSPVLLSLHLSRSVFSSFILSRQSSPTVWVLCVTDTRSIRLIKKVFYGTITVKRSWLSDRILSRLLTHDTSSYGVSHLKFTRIVFLIIYKLHYL